MRTEHMLVILSCIRTKGEIWAPVGFPSIEGIIFVWLKSHALLKEFIIIIFSNQTYAEKLIQSVGDEEI